MGERKELNEEKKGGLRVGGGRCNACVLINMVRYAYTLHADILLA